MADSTADTPKLESKPVPTTVLPPGEDVNTETALDPEVCAQVVAIPAKSDSHAAGNRSSLPANSELSPILERDELTPSPPTGDQAHMQLVDTAFSTARLDGPTPTPRRSATATAAQDAETRMQASFSAPQLRSLLNHASTRAHTPSEMKASTTRRSRARSPSPGPGRRPRSRKSSVRSVDRDTVSLSPAELVEVDRKLAMLDAPPAVRVPSSTSAAESRPQPQAQYEPKPIISTHEYMHAVLYGADMPQGADQKSERLSNFFQVPVEVEKTLWLGYVISLASLVSSKWEVHPNHVMDVYRFVILASAVAILLQIDPSHTYHFIRGQSMIKLYVIFNLLEVCDRLCCSFGMDILDSLFVRVNPASMGLLAKPNRLPLVLHAMIAVGYVALHAVVFLYQMITLNVTINSHNNALVSLIISNQFIEVKSTVFKRFEVEPLFQITCSDMVERINLSVFLTLNVVRNYLELANNTDVTGSWVVSVPVLWWTGGGAWLWQSAANLATTASNWLDATDFARLTRHVLDYLTASTWGEITLPFTEQLWPATQAVSDWVAEVYHRYRYVLCLELSDSITAYLPLTPVL
ncbi:Transmembrane anterior posterior transformation protein 1 [Allomyces arbusculus]|nr:Transmembrane anterior posterior transformation protein 1 [Allomyces arbusculus]